MEVVARAAESLNTGLLSGSMKSLPVWDEKRSDTVVSSMSMREKPILLRR